MQAKAHSNLLEMEILGNRTRRFFRQSPLCVAFDGHLDPPVSGTDGAILFTGGVSTKEEWVMACQVLDPLITPPLPLLRACTALIMAKPPPSDPPALPSVAALSIWSNTMRRRVYIWSNRLNKSGVILPIYFVSIYFNSCERHYTAIWCFICR